MEFYVFDAMKTLSQQLATLTQRLENLQVGVVNTPNLICDFCGGNHMNGACEASVDPIA